MTNHYQRVISGLMLFFGLILSVDIIAQSTINPNAQVVHLRKNCISQGSNYIDNCFENTNDLTNWLWGGGGSARNSQPSESDRVHVAMGPGDFEPFECPGQLGDSQRKGWVSVEGAGREHSRFIRTVGTSTGIHGAFLDNACRGAIHVEHCSNLEFSHLAAIGRTGAFWLGAGKGVWNDIDAIGANYDCGSISTMGWYDLPGGASEKSLQYVFGGRIWGNADSSKFWTIGLNTTSAEIWLYGTDIAVLDIGTSLFAPLAQGVLINNLADVRLFGGSIRAVGSNNNNASGNIRGVDMQGGQFHMHGGIISLNDAQTTNSPAMVGIYVNPIDSAVTAHTPGTAFVLTGGGQSSKHRLVNTGAGSANIWSPFLWQSLDTPPQAGDNSLHGQDLFVDTSSNGSAEAHLMVRDDTCSGSGGPWRDMATGNCRTP